MFKVWILPPVAIVFSVGLVFWMLRGTFTEGDSA
jgi:hypothetical protein